MTRRDHIESDHYDATHGYDEREPTRFEAGLDARRSDPLLDPMWHVADLVARDCEELARRAYGDGTVDAAIARVIEEEGF